MNILLGFDVSHHVWLNSEPFSIPKLIGMQNVFKLQPWKSWIKSRTLVYVNHIAEIQKEAGSIFFGFIWGEDTGEQKGQKRSWVRTGHWAGGEGCQATSRVLEKGEGGGSNCTSWETDRQSGREGLLLFQCNWSFLCLLHLLPYLWHAGSHEECSGCWCSDNGSGRVGGGGSSVWWHSLTQTQPG